MSRFWKCGLCSGAFICLLISELLTHFFIQHRNEENFCIKCGIQGCENKYRLYNSLYKHVRSKHVAFLSIPANELTEETEIDFDLVLQPETNPPGTLNANEVRNLFCTMQIVSHGSSAEIICWVRSELSDASPSGGQWACIPVNICTPPTAGVGNLMGREGVFKSYF